MFLLTGYLLFSCLCDLTEANSTHLARMLFTDKETMMKRVSLPGHHAPVRMVLGRQPDTITVARQKSLLSVNFKNPAKPPVERVVSWGACSESRDCNYNITLVHETEEANKLFVCGTDGRQTQCCYLNLLEQSPVCSPSEKLSHIAGRMKEFVIKEGEQSVFVEESADLYTTHSGSQDYVGIHRFGEDRVGPAHQDKEQHYVNLVRSKQNDNQDKVYGFYKEKNGDTRPYSEMWLPFVTRVCMADKGGPKNLLQLTWTSQMNARLFCGDTDSRQHFSELVDVTTVHADRWQDTRVYALFRNEWGMSGVCVYTMGDIDQVFKTSPFKGQPADTRSRECVADSRKIPLDVLKMIVETSEMEQWVRPVKDSGPLVFNHHSYTHIYVDSSQPERNEPVLFLTMNNGGIHKVIRSNSHAFVIAEYWPFSRREHIASITLHPASKKLYVNSQSELVQLDVANCSQYGSSCEDCVLAQDPYCGWKDGRCTSDTNGTLQDVARGDHSICKTRERDPVHRKVVGFSPGIKADRKLDSVRLPSNSKYFFECPVSSRHAQYTWHHPQGETPCNSKELQCLYLIDSMNAAQVGKYKCESEERGYTKIVAQHQLQEEQRNRAVGRSSGPLLWVCLMAVLVKTWFC